MTTPLTQPRDSVSPAQPPPPDPSDREQSVSDLLTRASRDLSLLVRQELELAKVELASQAKRAGLGAGLLAGAAVLGLGGFLMLSVAIALFIHSAGLALSWSFLIVTGGYLLVAGMFGLGALGRLTKLSPPVRTIATVKSNLTWARHPAVPPTVRKER